MQIVRLTSTLLLTLSMIFLAACQEEGISPAQLVETGLTPRIPAPGQANWTIEERMAHYGVHALSLAVVKDNELVFSKAYGVTDSASGTPVTENTLFQMAGGSRLATEVAALKMVSDGAITLDAPINDTLRSWKVPEDPLTEGAPVTLHNLLSHSAGLNVTHFMGYQADDEIPTLSQVLEGEAPANSAALRVFVRPGGRPRPVHGGFAIIQQALEDIAGKPFAEVMQETVLGPLGMTRSTFEQPLPPERLAEAATGHFTRGTPVPGKGRIFPETAANGMWSTPAEMAQVLIELMRATQGETSQVVKHETQKENLGTVLSADSRNALQFGERDRLDADDGFFTLILFYPLEGLAAVIAANTSNANDLAREVSRAIARAYEWPNFLSREVNPVAMTAEELDLFTGRYAEGQDNAFIVTRGDGHLLIRHALAPRADSLIPVAEDVFVNQNNTARLTFRRERDGRAAAYSFRTGPNAQETVRGRLKDDDPRPTELLMEGRIAEAVEAYRQIDPPPPVRRFNLIGYKLFNLGKFEAAAAVFEHAAEIYPTSANVYDSLGEIYLAQGENEKAVEAFRQVSVFLLIDEGVTPQFAAVLEARSRYFLARLES